MHFPIAGFLLFGCASLSSCESVHPKLSAAVTKAAKRDDATKDANAKEDSSADLDALDAAVAVVDKRLVKTDKADSKKKEIKKAVKKVAKKSHKFHWVAPAKHNKMPEADMQKSPMFQREKNLVISKEAEAVLAKGDAKAHELELQERQHAMDKLAPANVVHVSALNSQKAKVDVVEEAKDLASDVSDFKKRILSAQKHDEEVKKEEAEEQAEKASAKNHKDQPKAEKPQKKADLNKLMDLSNEMVTDAKPKASAAFLQQEPKEGIRDRSGIDSAAADLEATAQELASSKTHVTKKKVVHSGAHPSDQQFGALSHLKDSILKAKQVQQEKLKDEKLEKQRRQQAAAEAAEDAEALSGTQPAFDDPRLKEVKVTHVKHLSPKKLKSLKEAVGKMQDSVYVEPMPVKNMITDLKSGEEQVVSEATIHMHSRDGFGERPAPLPPLPPAPKDLPELPVAPPRPTEKPKPKPKPKPPAPAPHPHPHRRIEESPLTAAAMTAQAKPASPSTPAPKQINHIEQTAKNFEKVMHQNVVNMHAALRESTKETQQELASQLAAKARAEADKIAREKHAEEAKLARDKQTAEEKQKKMEQKEKAAALRKEEQEKAEAERNFAHQQMLDYRAAQKKARELKEKEQMEKKKAAERAARDKAAKESQAQRAEIAKQEELKAEAAEKNFITDEVKPSSAIRPSQFVSAEASHPEVVKEAKGSALAKTLGLSMILASTCLWW
jgi:hypothetical protein